jgi:uncharacterized membrane protein YccC
VTFRQSVLRFQREKISPWIALRNSAGVALVLALGIALGQISAALIATIGALNVSYSDSHAPYRQRARRMLAATALVGMAVFAGAVCGNHHVLAIPLAAVWAFSAGMLVALSTTAADLGSITLVTLLVFAAKPLPTKSAALSGLLALGGGLLQTALALAFWPVRRYVPERRALAALYSELARAATAPVDVHAAPPASAQTTQARAELASIGLDHSIDGERYRLLLSQAERTRLGLFLLGRLRTRIAREEADSMNLALVKRYLQVAAGILEAIGQALLDTAAAGEVAADLEQLQALTDDLRARSSGDASPRDATLQDARLQMDALAGQLRSAFDLATVATPEGLAAFDRQEVRKPWRLRLGGSLATLRANLSLRSAACRHAVRLAVCVALGDALARGYGFRRPYWLPMTIAIVLKPDFASTFSRGLLRLAGTLAGLVCATALFHLLPPAPMGQSAAIVGMMFVLRCWGPANYGILVTAVTGLVVFLIAMAGVDPKPVMAARAVNTFIGGGIALAAYWLWPTSERLGVREAMAGMLDSYREYFRAIRDSYVNPDASFEEALDRARSAARRARSNLEAAIDRWSGEPNSTPPAVTMVSGIMASSHRLIHAIMALEAGLYTSRPVPAREAFARFANNVELTLHSLAAALRGSPVTSAALPDLREDHHALIHAAAPAAERYALVNVETDRITNSLNTLSEELMRWVG